MGTSNLSVSWDAQLAASAGEIPAARVLTKDTAGRFVLATTANRAVWTGATMFAVSLTAGRGDQTVQACHAGFIPSSIVGTLSGSGSYVDCQSDGTMARATVSSVNTIADYMPTGDIVVDLSLQDGSTSSGSAGFILVSDYGTTDTALGLADTAAQASTPPKRLLATQQITLSNNVTVASEMVFEGGSITAASAKTLTANVVSAPEFQIVFGSALLAFTRGGSQKHVSPHWYGAKGNGITFTASVSSGSTALTQGGGTFTSAMVNRLCVCFDAATQTQVFSSTVSAFGTTNSLTMAAPSSVTITSKTGYVGTDDSTALAACIVSAAGRIPIRLAAGAIYMLGSSVSVRSGVILEGGGILAAGAVIAGGMLSSDPGTNTAGGTYGNRFTDITLDCCNLANYGILGANLSFPAQLAYIGGRKLMTNVLVQHALKTNVYLVASQSASIESLSCTHSGEHGVVLIACNASVFQKCVVTNTLGALMNAWDIDSSALGGGEVYLVECGAEQVTGYAVRVRDTTGSGTPVGIHNLHAEAIGLEAIYTTRDNTNITGGSMSGFGSYPVRIAANGCYTTPIDWQNFSSGATRVDTGSANCIVAANYNIATGGAFTDPSVADVWAGKHQIRHASGDQHMQGKLFIGSSTYTPSTTLDDTLMLHGHARLRTGGLQMHAGGVLSPYGGIGKGTNYLLRSEEFDSASWTKSNCTVTANSVLGPISGTLADTLAFTTSGGFIRQEYAYGSSLADLNWTSGIWMRTASGTASIVIAQSVGSAATISSTTWTITDEWQFIRTSGSSSNTGTTFRLQIGTASGTPTVYAWGACSQLVEDYAELAGGIDYAKTLGTVRTVKSQGPVFNAPPVLPGDSFTAVAGGKVAVAGAVVTITDARCTATCMVDFEPTNAAAVALGNALRTPAAGSFALTFGGAPAGTETFNYRLTEIWKL